MPMLSLCWMMMTMMIDIYIYMSDSSDDQYSCHVTPMVIQITNQRWWQTASPQPCRPSCTPPRVRVPQSGCLHPRMPGQSLTAPTGSHSLGGWHPLRCPSQTERHPLHCPSQTEKHPLLCPKHLFHCPHPTDNTYFIALFNRTEASTPLS